MDKTTTIQELKDQTLKFSEERDWDKFHTPKDMAMNAIIELGELLDHFRFRTDDEIRNMLKDDSKMKKIKAEYSDAFYSLLRLSDLLGIDASNELQIKLKEIAKKYPISKSKGNVTKYSDF